MNNLGKKCLVVGLVAVALSSSIVAAPKKSKGKDPYKNIEKQKDPKTNKVYDFSGMKVVIGDWWTNPDAAPSSKQQEDQKIFQSWVCKTYNVNVVQKEVAGWASMPQYTTNYCISGGENGEYTALIVDGRSAIVGVRSHLFYDLSKVTSVNFKDSSIYDQVVVELLKKGNSFYAYNFGVSEPREGMFFNKRLLEESGYDPDEPYDLQAKGEWTWAKFEEMCKKLTRDTDNDGVIDQYAMSNFYTSFTRAALDSNGGSRIGRDDNGVYFNNAGSDKSMEAFNWIQYMFTNYQMPQAEGAAWNYFESAFVNGETAFMCHQEYIAQPTGLLSSMKDDFGFVAFPLGPSGEGVYKTIHDTPMIIIPNIYSEEEVNKLCKAIELWKGEVPGYDGPDAWKESYYAGFRDSRAVDETITLMAKTPNPRFDAIIPGLSQEDMCNSICWGWRTPMEEYEATKNVWEGLLKDVNR